MPRAAAVKEPTAELFAPNDPRPSAPAPAPKAKKADKPGTAVAKHSPASAPAVPESPAAQTLSLIGKLASDPAVDADKFERLLAAQERMLDREAKLQFSMAMVAMQPRLPTIDRKGAIIVRAKDSKGERNGKVTQSTPYAKWEDINETITPILAEHGFAISFRPGSDADGRVTVTGVLRHAGGHQEEATMALMLDTTGSKNNVQAAGSSVSYGKRMIAVALLNLTTRDMHPETADDDGASAGAPAVVGEPITTDELGDLIALAEAEGCPQGRLLEHLNSMRPYDHPEAPSLAYLPKSRLQFAIDSCRNYGQTQRDRAAGKGKK